MPRPRPFDFTQPSTHKIASLVKCSLIGLDADGNCSDELTDPSFEPWFKLILKLSNYTGNIKNDRVIPIITDGKYWYKLIMDGYDCVIGGPDQVIVKELLHPNDKPMIEMLIKNRMAKYLNKGKF